MLSKIGNNVNFSLYNGDCTILMKNIPDASINCIFTDPPYKYLKNQKLEVDFDETIFFNEAKRILKNNGFIVLFGRGTSFYRWNTRLFELGFCFKEEFAWDKGYTTSPVHVINRTHETISVHTKMNGTLNRVKIPYTEAKSENYESMLQDIKRIKSALKNTESLNHLIKYVEFKIRSDFKFKRTSNYNTTLQTNALGKQEVNSLMAIVEGMKEKSIIKVIREHYSLIHPTQKPVRLIERILALTTKENDLVFDPFSGSCSTGIACLNTNRKFIGYEIDREYYNKSIERLKQYESLFFDVADNVNLYHQP